MGSKSNAFNHVCTTCRRILDIVRDVGCHEGLVHHEKLESLAESAKSACGICMTLLDELNTRKTQQVYDLSVDRLFPIECECDTSGASWQSAFDITFGLGPFGSLKFTFEAIGSSSEHHCPAPSTDSAPNWALIQKWLQECTQNHKRCNARPPQPWAPLRLLDLSSFLDGFVSLAERDKSLFSDQPYATLSHCWGDHMPVQLFGWNYGQHHKQILIRELPKTFQDAIRIATILKLRYLWIDTLCIVQDSGEDLRQQIGQMGKVYRYGIINIAATGAANGDEGCFWDRSPHSVRPTFFSIQWSNTPHDEVKSYQVVPDANLWARRFVSEPLLQRGWVFQERILSSRMLHFGQQQLFWECRESVACETYPHGLPASLRENTLIDIKTLDLGDEPKDSRWPAKYESAGFSPHSNLTSRLWNAVWQWFKPITLHQVTLSTPVNRPSVYRDWDAAVELYSLGALSFESDKLAAVSGLADAICIGDKGVVEDGYLAGLWQSSLPSHLLWTTEIVTTKRNREDVTLTPHQIKATHIAPSWSWASISGKISFKWCQYNYDAKDYLAELKSAEMIWPTHDSTFGRFGQLENGQLRLSAPLASALWNSGKYASSMSAAFTHVYPSEMDQHNAISLLAGARNDSLVCFDTPERSNPKVLTLLPVVGVTKRTAHDNETVCGLVLRKKEGTDDYVRLGMFHTTQERACRILKNMPRRTVTIV